MNLLESAIAYISPEKALRRAQARRVLAAYEAAKPTVLRKQSRDAGSGDRWVSQAGNNLRNQARYLDANHDLAKGVLNALVNNTIGHNGIGVEPEPQTFGGEIHEELADQLSQLWKDWCKNPECTFSMDWPAAQRLLARTWYRDGEVLSKNLLGKVPFLDHGTAVRYTLELLEPDMLPLLYDDPAKRITQGIQRNAWGKALNYYLHRNHPGDLNVFSARSLDFSTVSADLINHLRIRERISQVRGVSVFASVMTRLDDIKDYEESERIAAKIAASMAAFIKKGNPDLYDPETSGNPRNLRFSPGMVFDDLMPGEEIGTIDTNRPNPQLVEYRKGQLKAVSVGTNTSYATVASDYYGSWSSQRQEQAETWMNYRVLTAEFISGMARPVWERFVKMAVLDGLVDVPGDIDWLTLTDAQFIGPSMPVIDQAREFKANAEGERAGYITGAEIIRARGKSPRDLIKQEARYRNMQKQAGIISTADPANDKTGQNNEQTLVSD